MQRLKFTRGGVCTDTLHANIVIGSRSVLTRSVDFVEPAALTGGSAGYDSCEAVHPLK
jgi:hypothetical protein